MRILTLSVILLTGTASAQEAVRGMEVFANHCATCHGVSAMGDGPMTSVLAAPPPDLSVLSAQNAGVFPMARVVRRIDGTAEVLAHGGPMPLWGMILDGPSAVVVAPDGAEIVAPETIVDVAEWLKAVQR